MYEDKSIGYSVNITTKTRPIKIAYIVPHEESEHNNWILDAVFYESYTRWAGVRTLIIPSDANSFIYEEQEEWLKFYDADFVYSYVDIEKDLIEKIDRLCSPIAILRHKNYNDVERWRDYTPDWGRYIKPVSSISTIHSPHSGYYRNRSVEESKIPTLVTQYSEITEERFIADNFGIAWDTINYPNPITGLFETLCLVSEIPTGILNVGTSATTSITDILSDIAQKKVLTFAKLAMAHSDNVSKLEPFKHSKSFSIFVGDSYIDRINFWNFRHFTPSWIGIPGALLIRESLFEDKAFVEVLGTYLNNNNYLGHNSGQPEVTLKSLSLEKEKLKHIQGILNEATYNQVFVPDDYATPAAPDKKDIKRASYSKATNLSTFKVNEKENNLHAEEPEHFAFAPMRFYGLNGGQWAIDLEIERHNNLSKYANVTDTWKLPRRRSAASCFTNNLSKISKNNLLTIIPASRDNPFSSSENIRQKLEYKISLPEDNVFFRCLATGYGYTLPQDDLRHTVEQKFYQDIALSDKGQNLRGVISMFDSLGDASWCLTNRFWREALAKCYKKDALECEKIFGCLPKSKSYKKYLQTELRLKDKEVNKYLVASFSDALEFLVERNVFYQVHDWRCRYCGHGNTKTIDEIKRKNECEVCKTEYFAPIDLKWKYKLNRFVSGSLCERNGMAVLWALGYLQNMNIGDSFYYLPEVDLYPDYDKPKENEIDILCVMNGVFYAVEVKKSVLGFTRKNGAVSDEETEKFIKEIEYIKPDVALLVFEQYCQEDGEKEQAIKELNAAVEKIKQCSVNGLKVEVIIALDNKDFSEYPVYIGSTGNRTNKILYK